MTASDLAAEIGRGNHGITAQSLALERNARLKQDLGLSAGHLPIALRRLKRKVMVAVQEVDICRATVYRQLKRYGITAPNQL